MKISLNWLRRYIDIEETPEAIGEALNLIGFEVESVASMGLAPLEHVIVGEVIENAAHPNADRLSVAQVITELEGKPHNIVCGAKNYAVGDRVLLALPDAVLPGNFRIKRSRLRGVVSEGMLCSERELGMGDDHAGIMVLKERPALGTPVNEVFAAGDTVFDIDVTANRPDCLSHLGIARELGAYFGLSFSYPETKSSPNDPFRRPHQQLIRTVKAECPENCPHYRAYSISGVKIGPSPSGLREALKALGLRPVNNVVDVTNFVLYELGQPLHAFDADKLNGGEINIRTARPGEQLLCLDGRERALQSTMTVIADASEPVAIGGVIGGLDTEVGEETTEVILESAYFNPSNIRLTSRRLGLSTDASYRFERGVDPQGAEFAALRAIDLILEAAGGELLGPAIVDGEAPMVEKEITLTAEFVFQVLGFRVEPDEIHKMLESLELEVRAQPTGVDQAAWLVGVPSFRLDLERPIDLVEEVMRIYGTDRIPDARVWSPGLLHQDDSLTTFSRTVCSYLVGRHFQECIHYSMRAEEELREWYTHAAADSLGLANPVVSDQTHLRTAVLPGLLDAVRLNQHRRNEPWRLFEIGRVFRERDGVVWEMHSVGFVMVQPPQSSTWLTREAPDFFTALNVVGHLLALAGVERSQMSFEPIQDDNPWQDGHAAQVGGAKLGFEAKVGLLNLAMLRRWEIEGTVLAGSLYFALDFLRHDRMPRRFTAFSQYPPTTKDLALVVDASARAGTVRNALAGITEEVVGNAFAVESVKVFDVYQGSGLEEGKKSLAFSLVFRASDRTLTDKVVNNVFTQIQKRIEEETNYTVRK